MAQVRALLEAESRRNETGWQKCANVSESHVLLQSLRDEAKILSTERKRLLELIAGDRIDAGAE